MLHSSSRVVLGAATGSALIGLGLLTAGCGSHSSETGPGLGGAIPVVTVTPPTRTETFTVPSASMEPTLHCAQPGSECEAATADRVVVSEPVRRVRRRDVVVFRTPDLAMIRCGAGGVFIKRVIGLPGETWEERAGHVYIDGARIAEYYIRPDRRDARTIAPIRIAVGHYFVMGDNRQSSCDSRAWGTVPAANLIGTVIRILRTG